MVTETLLAALMNIIITLAPHYEMPPTLPEVRYISEKKMESSFYGGKAPPGSRIEAFYDPITRRIYLRQGYDTSKAFEISTVFHEVVHYVQQHNGKPFDCIPQLEYEAYMLQKKYLEKYHGGKSLWDYVNGLYVLSLEMNYCE